MDIVFAVSAKFRPCDGGGRGGGGHGDNEIRPKTQMKKGILTNFPIRNFKILQDYGEGGGVELYICPHMTKCYSF